MTTSEITDRRHGTSLVIGLGGTGAEVIRALKELDLHQARISSLRFDLDRLEPGDGIARIYHVCQWLPEEDSVLDSPSNVKVEGRLGFFFADKERERAIRLKVYGFGGAIPDKASVDVAHVVICSSVVGGTGSGMLFDLGYFFRRLQRGIDGAARLRTPLSVPLSRPNVPALSAALSEIVRRHEILRTVHAFDSPEPMAPEPEPLLVVDLSGLPESGAEAARIFVEEAARPFDFRRGPIARATLLRRAKDDYTLLFLANPMISNGWSQVVLLRELMDVYGNFAAGRPSPLPELPVQSADFAPWQQEHWMGDALEKQLAYWREKLSPIPAGRDVLIHPRWARLSNLTVGSPLANRGQVEIEKLLGLFNNTDNLVVVGAENNFDGIGISNDLYTTYTSGLTGLLRDIGAIGRPYLNVEPPKVSYRGLLSTEEGGIWGAWLRRVTGKLFPRLQVKPPEPVPPLTMFLDSSGSLSRDYDVFLSFRRPSREIFAASKPGTDPGSTWEILFESLYDNWLPRSATEQVRPCGERLAHCLLTPAGRLPALNRFDRSRLIEILAELPGWKDEEEETRFSWSEATAGSCYRQWLWLAGEEEPRRAERKISWDTAERCGFFLNRALSYPDQEVEKHRDGLSQLGGLTRALSFAWLLLYRSLAVLPVEWTLSLRRSRTANLFTMAELIARIWGAEVRADSLEHSNAFLVRMKRRAVIYLRKQINSRQRAWGVCHELAHLVLDHQSHSSFGVDRRRLKDEEIRAFEGQEAVANALASLWLHLFEGLTEIGLALGRSHRAAEKPGRKRPPSAPSRIGAPAWRPPDSAKRASSAVSPPS